MKNSTGQTRPPWKNKHWTETIDEGFDVFDKHIDRTMTRITWGVIGVAIAFGAFLLAAIIIGIIAAVHFF